MTNKLNRVLAAVLTIATLGVGQTAWAQSSNWTVTNEGSGNIFTIKRSDNSKAETIRYRTVSQSAFATKHFLNKYGSITFAAGVKWSENITVEELDVIEADAAYMFQIGETRSYRFEVLDEEESTVLASCVRDMGNSPHSVSAAKAFEEKTAHVGGENANYHITDAGYSQNYLTVYLWDYFTATANQRYLKTTGADLRMTVSLDAYEEQDGYQYIQILTNETTYCDEGAKDGNPGTISLSSYMAGFEHKHGAKDESTKSYTFPVTTVGNNAGASNPWGHGDKYNLCMQKFNDGCRASDGRIIIPANVSTLGIRFSASGGDKDDWRVSNIIAHIQAVDTKAPTVIDYTVAEGWRRRNCPTTVSLAFSEVVEVTGTPTLTTTWGTFTYEAGSGSNVLSFSGTITAAPGTILTPTALSGTVKDLSGNTFNGSMTGAPTHDAFRVGTTNTLTDLQPDGTNRYLISTKADLYLLSALVNDGQNMQGKTFVQTANITCDNSYETIGRAIPSPFKGTYDGGGHAISGITISKAGFYNMGIFGVVTGGMVSNVILRNSSFTSKQIVGGIVGNLDGGTVENCIVESTVAINAYNNNSQNFGGIVGINKGTVAGCLSAATVTNGSCDDCNEFGGIVGINYGTVKDCLYTGSTVAASSYVGAIVGDNSGTCTNNYYTNSSLNIGGINGSNRDGGRLARRITLMGDVGLSGTQTTYSISQITAIGSSVIKYQGRYYSGEEQEVGLTYNGTVPEGYRPYYNATGGSINGSTLTMPAANVIVTATVDIAIYTITFNGIEGATFATANPTSYTSSSDGFTLCNPTREGYRFTGWSGTDIDGLTMTVTIPKGSSGDRTYTANWIYQLTLANDGSNTDIIKSNRLKNADVTLQGRTIYRDGTWNTLCLPINMTISGSVLDGAEVRQLSSSSFENGILTLNFTKPFANITNAQPYIIRWPTPQAENLVNPVITEEFIIYNTKSKIETDYVTFQSTYDQLTFTEEDRSILFLGANNTLYYPDGKAPTTIGACRAYFQLKGIQARDVSATKLYFGDEEPLSISPEGEGTKAFPRDGLDGVLYNLSGQRLSKPQKGINIVNGKKVLY